MANLREQSLWEEGVYQIETSDPVMGGENGVSNRPIRQLANRTQWLKTEAARLDRLIGTNLSTVNQGLSGKVDKTTQVTAGAGLTGGGTLSGNIQIQLGTPGKLNGTTTNWAGSNTHTHEIDKATPTVAGVVKLINNLTAGGTDAALSAEQGKALKQLIDTAAAGAVPYTGAAKHIDLNGKNLANAGEVKLGNGNSNNYAQVLMGNYNGASGQGTRQMLYNNYHDSGRWAAIGTFDESGTHLSSLFADADNAYLKRGSNQLLTLATRGTTLAHYGIAGNQELIGGRLTIKGREHPSLALQSTLGNSDLWLESSGSRHYFIRRGRGSTSGGDILYLPDHAGTLATLGTTLAHYGITDAASRTDITQAAPPGAIMYFAGRNPPSGWLKANGAAVSRTTYAPLFAAIGTAYGSGNGRTTFNLPDLRGEFLRGWDDGRGVDAGRGLGSAQADEFKSHTHGGVPHMVGDSDRGGAHSWFTLDGSGVTAATGGSETRPRNVALLACIKI